MAITQKTFSELLQKLDLGDQKNIALALSGGGDSMALAFLVTQWAKKKSVQIHLLTVDHGLRKESAKEARQVAEWVKKWPVVHKILTWKGIKPKAKIQEAAREARYKLMADYCRKHNIDHLLLAHHGDDQVETFLFRLAKGSGLDGLTVMKFSQAYDDRLTLVRPLLNFSHKDLLGVCEKNKLPWIEDPSNDTDRFARVRMRRSREVLSQEGLTTERILTLGNRLDRARKALEQVTVTAEKNCIVLKETRRIEISFLELQKWPEEIVFRILQKSLKKLSAKKAYPPRMQNLEKIVSDLISDPKFKASSLYGCIIRIKRKAGLVEIIPEIK